MYATFYCNFLESYYYCCNFVETEIPVLTNESPSESDESSGVDMLLIIIIAAAIVIAIILVSVVLLFICCMCHGSR